MALREAKVDIILDNALDENVDPKLLPMGFFRTLKNTVLDKRGVAVKREGWSVKNMAVLAPPGPFASAAIEDVVRFVPSRGGELNLLDDNFVWTYSPDRDAWAPKAEWGSLKGERIGFWESQPGSIEQCDVAYSSGLLCVVYRVRTAASSLSPEIFCAILDARSGAVLMLHKQIFVGDDYGPPRVIVCGTTFVCVAHRDGSGHWASKLSATAPSAVWTTPAQLTTVTAEYQFDICSGGANLFVIGYYDSAATRIRFQTWDLTLAGATNTVDRAITFPANLPLAISIDFDGTNFHVAYYRGVVASRDIEYRRLQTNLVVLTTVSVATGILSHTFREVDRIAVKADPVSTVAIVVWMDATTTTLNYGTGVNPRMKWRGVFYTAGTVLAAQPVLPWHVPVAQPMLINGQFVLLVSGVSWMSAMTDGTASDRSTFGSISPSNVFVLGEGIYATRVDPAALSNTSSKSHPVGAYLLGDGIGQDTSHGAPFLGNGAAVRGAATDGTSYFVGVQALEAREIVFVANKSFCRSSILKLTPDVLERGVAIEGSTPILLGGLPTMFDDFSVPEFATLWPPVIKDLQPAGGGALNPSGIDMTYFYRCVVEWISKSGDRVFSEPSLLCAVGIVAASANISINVQVRASTLSSKSDWYPYTGFQPRLKVYRGITNDAFDLRLVGTIDLELEPTDYYTINDNITDALLLYNEPIYTLGGEFDNTCMPSCHVGCVANQRAYMRSDERKSRVFWSKAFVLGRAPEFSYKTQFLDFPQDIQGAASLDGQPYFISATGVYAVSGQGPGRNGQGGQLQIVELSQGVGTQQSLSVIATPIGVMFANEVGFWIADKGGGVQPALGSRDLFRQYPTIIRAKLDPKRSMVRFLCTNLDGGKAVLCFNWVRRLWFHHELLVSDFLKDIGIADGTFYLASGDQVFIEGGYEDEGQFYPHLVRTGPFRTDDALEGFGRCWYVVFSMRWQEEHGLKATIRYNENGTVISEHVRTDAEVTGAGTNEKLRCHLKSGHQASNYFDFQIEDTEPVSTGGTQGFELNGLTLEYGVKQGVGRKIKEAQKV